MGTSAHLPSAPDTTPALNMKTAVALLALLGCAAALPQVLVLRDESVAPNGAEFRTAFELDNNINIETVGTAGAEGQSNMRGFYLVPGEGDVWTRVDWTADEAGFVASG